MEIDNDELLLDKFEIRIRINNLLLTFGTICLFICGTLMTIIHWYNMDRFDLTKQTDSTHLDNFPKIEDKIILYDNGSFVTYQVGKAAAKFESNYVKLQNHRRNYAYKNLDEIFVVYFEKKVEIISQDWKPKILPKSQSILEFPNADLSIVRFGVGIQIMNYYWIAGFSFYNDLSGFYKFQKETALWSITKKKWIKGPKLPFLLGIEEGCMTLLNRTSILIFGMTTLIRKLNLLIPTIQ